MAKLAKDQKDYEDLGGNIPPRPNSMISSANFSPKTTSVKEYRASQFDFSSTRPRWVNRDISHEPAYMRLSDGFKKVFEDAKVQIKIS